MRINKGMKRKKPELSDKSKCHIEDNEEEKTEKLFVVEEGDNLRLISKETMDDIDLIVNIYNSLVSFHHYSSLHIIR